MTLKEGVGLVETSQALFLELVVRSDTVRQMQNLMQ